MFVVFWIVSGRSLLSLRIRFEEFSLFPRWESGTVFEQVMYFSLPLRFLKSCRVYFRRPSLRRHSSRKHYCGSFSLRDYVDISLRLYYLTASFHHVKDATVGLFPRVEMSLPAR